MVLRRAALEDEWVTAQVLKGVRADLNSRFPFVREAARRAIQE
jgi:hypothetical protein